MAQKLFSFYRDLHSAVLLFTKPDKHSLGQTLQAKSLQLIETVYLASRSTEVAKRDYLVAATARLDLIKLLVRLGNETGSLSDKKYIALQTYLQEIGRMLGGWLRSVNQ